jgi:hypothetical protein
MLGNVLYNSSGRCGVNQRVMPIQGLLVRKHRLVHLLELQVPEFRRQLD